MFDTLRLSLILPLLACTGGEASSPNATLNDSGNIGSDTDTHEEDSGDGDAGDGDTGDGDTGDGDTGEDEDITYPCEILSVQVNAGGQIIDFYYGYDEQMRIRHLTFDYNQDDTIERTLTWDYNEHDQLTEYRVVGTSSAQLTRYVYDEAGELSQETVDESMDDTIDERVSWSYATEGDLEIRTSEHDVLDDGSVDRIYRITVDPDARTRTEEFDDNVDGTIDRRVIWTEDAFENTIFVQRDFDGDNIIDEVERRDHIYENGFIKETTKDIEDDGTVDEVTRFTRRADGLVYTVDVTDGDGNRIRTQTFDLSACE